MRLAEIVSVDRDWAIGKGGGLVVKNRDDMLRFRRLTMGHTVIMGRRTFESLPGGKPLDGRRNIVLTSSEDFSVSGVIIAHGLGEAFDLLSGGGSDLYDDEAWVIGGETVYREFLPYVESCFVTWNDISVGGADAWFPNLDEDPGWSLDFRSCPMRNPSGLSYDYKTYRRV